MRLGCSYLEYRIGRSPQSQTILKNNQLLKQQQHYLVPPNMPSTDIRIKRMSSPSKSSSPLNDSTKDQQGLEHHRRHKRIPSSEIHIDKYLIRPTHVSNQTMSWIFHSTSNLLHSLFTRGKSTKEEATAKPRERKRRASASF